MLAKFWLYRKFNMPLLSNNESYAISFCLDFQEIQNGMLTVATSVFNFHFNDC